MNIGIFAQGILAENNRAHSKAFLLENEKEIVQLFEFQVMFRRAIFMAGGRSCRENLADRLRRISETNVTKSEIMEKTFALIIESRGV
jgi:hypothetical protein